MGFVYFYGQGISKETGDWSKEERGLHAGYDKRPGSNPGSRSGGGTKEPALQGPQTVALLTPGTTVRLRL